jgi:TonB family protein
MAMAAVAYAAGGGRLERDGLFGWLNPGQRLPALRSEELPFRFPARLWRAGAAGEVVLRVHITNTGAVDSVLLETSSGHEELDAIAIRGASELEYHPALRGEEPVAVWALLPVRFEGRSVTAGSRGE